MTNKPASTGIGQTCPNFDKKIPALIEYGYRDGMHIHTYLLRPSPHFELLKHP